jgi:uncharacterized protein YozE (UPF0346 family)
MYERFKKEFWLTVGSVDDYLSAASDLVKDAMDLVGRAYRNGDIPTHAKDFLFSRLSDIDKGIADFLYKIGEMDKLFDKLEK